MAVFALVCTEGLGDKRVEAEEKSEPEESDGGENV